MPVLGSPARFLVTSSMTVALLLVAWSQASGPYMDLLVLIANAVLRTLGVAVVLNPPPAAAPLVHPEVVGIAALYLCTPRRRLRWRLLWLGAVGLGLVLLHAGLLVADSWQAQRLLLTGGAMGPRPGDDGGIGLVRHWLPALAGLAAWFAAVDGHTDVGEDGVGDVAGGGQLAEAVAQGDGVGVDGEELAVSGGQ